MTTSLVFRAKSIGLSTKGGRSPVSLLHAARHNLRQTQEERGCRANINPVLTINNHVLAGPSKAEDVIVNARLLKEKYVVSKKKLRKDHVQALEFVISLPITSSIDAQQYFPAALAWFTKCFGFEMVLSAVVHHDEAAPHMHVLILPVANGTYKGGAPIDKMHLPKLIKLYGQEVGKNFGLRLERKSRWTSGERNIAAQMVLKHVNEHSDPILASRLWQPVHDDIERSPESYFGTLGLVMPQQKAAKRRRTFTQIMTSKGRPIDEDRMQRSSGVLSCVGFPKSQISFDGSSPRPQQEAMTTAYAASRTPSGDAI
jgi:hypothetical protein